MRIIFTLHEIKSIVIATAVLSVAFAIASSGLEKLSTFPTAFLFSLISVGIGFIAHELLGHKLLAQKFDYYAEFVLWPAGLVIALAFSFLGFVFAAPGAVMIGGRPDLWGEVKPITRKKYGLISLGGPVVNIVLALLFITLNFFSPFVLWSTAAMINVWLALFNMLPFPPLDGSKVFAWDKKIFVTVFAVIIALFVFVGF
ncbi:site-2 protease family protein [archaeon]|nr:site-2 protease family protein [archaeon]